MTGSTVRTYAGRARRAVRRMLRGPTGRRLAETEAELRRTRRRLRRTRTELREVRAELEAVRVRLDGPPAEVPAEVEAVIARVRAELLTYLDADNLRTLASCVVDVERRELPGLVIEAGAARGGSAIVIAAAKAPGRPMKVYDVFGMIPPPSKRDGPDVHERYRRIVEGRAAGPGGETYYGYRDDLYAEVRASFARLGVPPAERNVELIRGLFADTIRLDEPVAFAHLDGDWYESTMTCLVRIAPLLVPGGRIVLDDYYTWSGCRAAVDDYFAGRDGFRLERRARLHVVRE